MRRLVAAALAVAGWLPAYAQDAVKAPAPRTVLQAEGGRYVLGQISDFRQDQYLLDTRTGRVWVVVYGKDAQGANTIRLMQPVPFTSMNDDKWSADPR